MAFGWSIGDILLLSNLAWKALQNTRNACGEHDQLTSELLTLHTVLRRLHHEVSKPESVLNAPGYSSKEDVERIVSGCHKPLSLLDKVVEKYSLLSQEERSLKKLWLQVRFGNGEIANTRDIRDKISMCTSSLTLYLNLVSTGSMGRVEKQMEDAGSDLKEVKQVVNNLAARLAIGPHSEGSVLTTRTNDDKAVWKEFRRSLLRVGFNSSFLKKHKSLIEAYVKELGDRGVLDDPQNSDRIASDVGSPSLQQCNPASKQEVPDLELEREDPSRSASPAFEVMNDPINSSATVVMSVAASQKGSSTIPIHENPMEDEKPGNYDKMIVDATTSKQTLRQNVSKQIKNHQSPIYKHVASLQNDIESDLITDAIDPDYCPRGRTRYRDPAVDVQEPLILPGTDAINPMSSLLPFAADREPRSRFHLRQNTPYNTVRDRRERRRINNSSSDTGSPIRKRTLLKWMAVGYGVYQFTRKVA